MSAPAHTPNYMLPGTKYPRKHTGHNGRRWNVWHVIYGCPICKESREALMNPMRGRAYVCFGDHFLVVKRRAA